MLRKFQFSLFFLVVACMVGCGGSTAPAVTAEMDEMEQYAAENPSPEPQPGAIDGDS